MRGIVFLAQHTFGLLFLINGVLSIPIIKPYDETGAERGCCISCGYTWCEDLQECVRPWETYCKSLEN